MESESDADTKLIATRKCRLSTESDSVESASDAEAKIFLFTTALCIEQQAFLVFTRQEVIPLSSLLGLVYSKDDATEQGKPDQLQTFELQMKGSSIRLAMDRRYCTDFAKDVERARLASLDKNKAVRQPSVASMAAEGGRSLSASPPANQDSQVDAGTGRRSRHSHAMSISVAPEEAQELLTRIRQDSRNSVQLSTMTDDSFYLPRDSSPNLRDLSTSVIGARRYSHTLETLVQQQVADIESSLHETTVDANGATVGKTKLHEYGQLTPAEWTEIFQGAKYRRYRGDETILDPFDSSKKVDGLVQVVRGTLRIEAEVPNRPQAMVVGRVRAGELVGVASHLLKDMPFARVVCDSETAATIRLPSDYIDDYFDERPDVAGKFYFFLAQRQAQRLRTVTADMHEQKELRIKGDMDLPRTIEEVMRNDAFLMIFHKFIRAQTVNTNSWDALVQFVYDVRALHKEGDIDALFEFVRNVNQKYLGNAKVSGPLYALDLTGLADHATEMSRVEDALSAVIGILKHGSDRNSDSDSVQALVALRHVFDSLQDKVTAALQETWMNAFVSSQFYDYVMMLRMKESEALTLDHFKIARTLGEGNFGQVLEVIKRDCGKRYAMKVMRKTTCIEVFGEDDWETLTLIERTLLANLQHPLLINLAYSFQNLDFLVFVTDVCYGGDLEDFGAIGAGRLTSAQVRFVGIEVVCVLCYLQRQRVLFRDLKPANLLFDEGGHVRLIDFGVSKQAPEGKHPISREECGSGVYMAPEVKKNAEEKSPYSYSCDWFSFGVLLYELQEKAWPYGESPEYADVAAEFVQPKLLDSNGQEVPHMYDVLSGLLDWDPATRLGIDGGHDALRDHPYWGAVDWELVESKRVASPLQQLVAERIAKRVKKWDAEIAGVGGTTRAADRTASVMTSLKRSQDQQMVVDKRKGENTNDAIAAADDKLVEQEERLLLDGWDFVSEHALAQEYVEMAAHVVSIV